MLCRLHIKLTVNGCTTLKFMKSYVLLDKQYWLHVYFEHKKKIYSVSWLAQSKVWQEISYFSVLSQYFRFYTACFDGISLDLSHLWKNRRIDCGRTAFFSTFHLQYLSRSCFHALIYLLRNHRNGLWYSKCKSLCIFFFSGFFKY